MHEVDGGYQARMRNSRRLAEAVQGMMCDIISARNASSGMAGDARDGELVLELGSDDDEMDVISVSSTDDDLGAPHEISEDERSDG